MIGCLAVTGRSARSPGAAEDHGEGYVEDGSFCTETDDPYPRLRSDYHESEESPQCGLRCPLISVPRLAATSFWLALPELNNCTSVACTRYTAF